MNTMSANYVVMCVLFVAILHVNTSPLYETTTVPINSSPLYETTTATIDSWTKSEFPNPQLDVDDCGNNGSKSWVCDPARLLSRQEVDALNELIIQLRGDDSCQGWVAAVAVVMRIHLRHNKYPSTDNDKLEATREFADYLLKTWKFGDCDNDLVIVVSKSDRTVWTSTASGVRKKLSDECVTKIYKETRHGSGLIYLLEQYTEVQSGQRDCGSGSTGAIIGAVFGALFGVLAVVIGVCLCKRYCCRGGGGDGGGGGGGGCGGGGGGGGGCGDGGGGGGGDF
ncbi:hypothetical protein LSAT2_032142 [Lamellibrachia satsuma]|nr:hypothetical protein LSAT2_032142 [Lamellibrachia satsuma]